MTTPEQLELARQMRRAGHTANALVARSGVTLDEAKRICSAIPLGWTNDGYFQSGRSLTQVLPWNAEAAL